MIDVAALYEAELPALRRYFQARLVGEDWAVADDLASDVFARAWEKRRTYVDRGLPVRVWLYRIARNRLVDHYKARRPSVPLDALRDRAAYSLHFEQIDARLDVAPHVEALPPKQRAAIVGRFYERRWAKELGHIATEDGIKKLQARALVNLRKWMEAA